MFVGVNNGIIYKYYISKGANRMKFKMMGLLLSTSLVLAACGDDSDDMSPTAEDPANVETTEGEGTSTEHGGTKQDAATEENTDDADDKDTAGESGDTSTEDDASTESTESSATSTGSSNNIVLEDINLNAEDALNIATNEFDGDLKEISFEHERDVWVYKVDLFNGNEEAEVIINQETEEVIDVRTEQENDDDADEVLDYSVLNEAESALDEAIADLGGGEVREWTLSMDDRVAEYDIELYFEDRVHEYTLDAETLEILETDRDD